ncbi:MAG: hypothetical protein M3310_06430 [Actinomycetota bacterium]|nr:hypothetical protein [Actinomycetota bacterium]
MRKTYVAIAAIALLAVAALAAVPLAGAKKTPTDRQLQALKAATARYHSVEQAIRAGYWPGPTPTSPGTCAAHPTAGAMGYHFENQALMRDGVLDWRRPEILMYERKSNGRYRLIGVEYYIQADQVAAAPTLFGQTFQGPMPAHHPGQTAHYDLHVWQWKHNPAGMFAEWNPDVRCP